MARQTILGRRASPHLDQPETPALAGAECAVAVIDAALLSFAGRALVAGDEVVDRLLDLRNDLTAAMAFFQLDAGGLA